MKFNSLQLTEWQQFKKIEIDFHPKVTIITGANGSGKSTILKLLSTHFGWNIPFLATPYLIPRQGSYKYLSQFIPITATPWGTLFENSTDILGDITYTNQTLAHIMLDYELSNDPQFNFKIHNQQNIDGLHINSHRPIPTYLRLDSIPTNPMNAKNAFDSYYSETQNLYRRSYSNHTPMSRMKEAIISMAAFGHGNDSIQKNEHIERSFLTFKNILKNVLPKSLGFQDLSIRVPDIVLITDSGEFLLDACSGGIMSIIDLAWQIFLYSHDKDEFVVTIDEPENHLHPSMQRSLLNDFVEAFPNAQFIVVTHSPFVVSSIKDSNVYALKYQDFRDSQNHEKIVKKVVSHKLDLNQKASTAHEILREVLGVPVTLPQWAEDDLQQICSRFTAQDVTVSNLALLRSELEQAGLGEFYPQALNNIVVRNFHD